MENIYSFILHLAFGQRGFYFAKDIRMFREYAEETFRRSVDVCVQEASRERNL